MPYGPVNVYQAPVVLVGDITTVATGFDARNLYCTNAASAVAVNARLTSFATANGAYSNRAFDGQVIPRISVGITNTSSLNVATLQNLRNGLNYDGTVPAAGADAGTLSNLVGINTVVGHLAAVPADTPQTTNVFGYRTQLTSRSGTITNAYGVYCETANIITPVTNPWGFYQAGTVLRNYFAGRTIIGNTPTDDGVSNLAIFGGALKTNDRRTETGNTFLTGGTAPVAGGTTTMSNTARRTILNPAGVLATYTLVMPAAPQDGQLCTFSSTQSITALTLNPNAGQSIVGAVTTLGAGTSRTYIYRATDTTWYPA